MSKVAFKQSDVERLLRAAKAVGFSAPAVDALPGGGLRLLTEGGAIEPELSPLEQWEREHGDGRA